MADFNLMAFVKSVDFESFYHYSGSLTTPPCTEVVTWVVFDKPIVAGPRQLEAFRKVQVQNSKGRSGGKFQMFFMIHELKFSNCAVSNNLYASLCFEL